MGIIGLFGGISLGVIKDNLRRCPRVKIIRVRVRVHRFSLKLSSYDIFVLLKKTKLKFCFYKILVEIFLYQNLSTKYLDYLIVMC